MVLTFARHAVADLDRDHAGADRLDRLLEVDLAAVDVDAAGLLDRVDDVLRGDRAEQAAVVAGLVGDGEHGLVEQRGALLGPRRRPRRPRGRRSACARWAAAIDALVAGSASLRGIRKLRR